MISLRERQKKAERQIATLKRSGQQSVEAMLDELLKLRKRKDVLLGELKQVNDDILNQELVITHKEDECRRIRMATNDEKAAFER